MEPSSMWGIAGAGFVLALVEVVKRTIPEIPDRFLPLVAVACGIAVQVYAAATMELPLHTGVFTGIVVGLSAMGIYSGAKKSLGN